MVIRTDTLHTLDRIATVLGVRVADLLSEEAQPAPKWPSAIMRIVSLLEREPTSVQRAAEKMVAVLVAACGKRERDSGFIDEPLPIHLQWRLS